MANEQDPVDIEALVRAKAERFGLEEGELRNAAHKALIDRLAQQIAEEVVKPKLTKATFGQ